MNSVNRQSLISYLQGTQATQAMGRNYVINPSGFQNTNNIVVSGTPVTRNTTTPLTSISDLAISLASNATDSVAWAINTMDNEMLNQNCEFRFVYKSSSMGSNVVAAVIQNGNILAKSSALVNSTTPQVVSLNSPCGDPSLSTGVWIYNDTGNTGTSSLNVANVTFGRATNLTNVSQAKFIGSAYFATTANCTFTRTSTSLGAFSDTDCPGPTVEYNPGPGIIQTTDANAPIVTVNNLGPGTYLVHFVGQAEIQSSAQRSALAISDGTTTSGQVAGPTLTSGSAFHVAGIFTYTSAGNRSFQLFGSSAANAMDIVLTTANQRLYFYIEQFPNSSQVAINSNNSPWYIDANIGGANPSLSTSAVASYTEITNSGLTLSQNTGSDSVGVACSSTNNSVVGATTCSVGNEGLGITFNIPKAGTYRVCTAFSFQIVGNAGANTRYDAAFELVETASNSQTILQNGSERINSGGDTAVASGDVINSHRVCSNFTFSSIGQKTIRLFYMTTNVSGAAATSVSVLADQSGNANITNRWEVYPVTNQQPQPLLVGSVTSNTSGLERIERASISSASAITSQSGSWITSVTDTGTGGYTVNIASGIFSGAPSCTVVAVGNSRGANLSSSSTTSSVFVRTYDPGVGDQDLPFELICMGPKA